MADPSAVARTVLLLRHAQTEDVRPGARDIQRRLTSHGELQARRLGQQLRADRLRVDAVLCSTATRARQTMELLDVDWPPEGMIDRSEVWYRAGTDTIVEALRTLDDPVRTVLVVGHAPAVPGVAYELADPADSDPSAAAAIADRFPPGTLARLEFAGAWTDLGSARLTRAILPA